MAQFTNVASRANLNYSGPRKFDSINQITKIRGIDGQDIAITDWSHRQIYSTIDTLSGWTDTELYGFTYTQSNLVSSSNNITGTNRRNATLRETNVVQAGQMGALEELLVYSMGVEIYAYAADGGLIFFNSQPNNGGPIPTAGIVSTCQDRLILELEVSQKAFFQASLGWWAAGFGQFGFPVAASSSSFSNNSFPSHASRWLAQVPVHIGGTEKFKTILHNPNGVAVTYLDDQETEGGAVSFRITLDALHKRPTS